MCCWVELSVHSHWNSSFPMNCSLLFLWQQEEDSGWPICLLLLAGKPRAHDWESSCFLLCVSSDTCPHIQLIGSNRLCGGLENSIVPVCLSCWLCRMADRVDQCSWRGRAVPELRCPNLPHPVVKLEDTSTSAQTECSTSRSTGAGAELQLGWSVSNPPRVNVLWEGCKGLMPGIPSIPCLEKYKVQ